MSFLSKIMSFEQLQELTLLENFKNCVKNVVVHLNDQKVMTLSEVAVISDEFMFTHKTIFSANHEMQSKLPTTENGTREDFRRGKIRKGCKPVLRRNGEKRVCFYCLDPSHI